MKTKFHLLAALTFCLHITNKAFAKTNSLAVAAKPEAKNLRQPIREVTLSGNGYELGLQHGESFHASSSVIMMLTEKPFVQITSGPPDESEYKRVDFSNK